MYIIAKTVEKASGNECPTCVEIFDRKISITQDLSQSAASHRIVRGNCDRILALVHHLYVTSLLSCNKIASVLERTNNILVRPWWNLGIFCLFKARD